MRKVVVTGMGCVSGLGPDIASTWQTLVAGAGAIKPIKIFAEGQDELFFEGVGASVPADAGAPLRGHFDEKQLSGIDPFSTFAAVATLEALQEAGLWGDKARLARAAIVYGSASGGNLALETGYRRLFYSRLPNVHPMTIPRFMNSAAISHLSMLFGVRGHTLAISSACASSAHAIGEAMHAIRAGRASVAITGGSDASLTFGSLRAGRLCRPWRPMPAGPFRWTAKAWCSAKVRQP